MLLGSLFSAQGREAKQIQATADQNNYNFNEN